MVDPISINVKELNLFYGYANNPLLSEHIAAWYSNTCLNASFQVPAWSCMCITLILGCCVHRGKKITCLICFFSYTAGIGYGQIFVGAYVGIYYNVIITYTIYYFFASMRSTLPWVGCHHSFNTPNCSDLFQECLDNGGIVSFNGTCIRLDGLSNSELKDYNISKNFGGYNITGYIDPLKDYRKSGSEEYWK